MAIDLNDNTWIHAGKPSEPKSLNGSNAPYADVAAANARIPIGERYITLTVNVAGKDYWYYPTVADGSLVRKGTDLSDLYVPLLGTTAMDGVFGMSNTSRLDAATANGTLNLGTTNGLNINIGKPLATILTGDTARIQMFGTILPTAQLITVGHLGSGAMGLSMEYGAIGNTLTPSSLIFGDTGTNKHVSLNISGVIATQQGTGATNEEVRMTPTGLRYQYNNISSTIAFTHPTTSRTITFQNGTGTVAFLSDITGGSTSPLTTKGDLWAFSTVDARLPVGADGFLLAADSSTATGLAYVDGNGFLTKDINTVHNPFVLQSPNALIGGISSLFSITNGNVTQVSTEEDVQFSSVVVSTGSITSQSRDLVATNIPTTTWRVNKDKMEVDGNQTVASIEEVNPAFFGIVYKYQYLTYAASSAVTTYDRYLPDIKFIKDALSGLGGGTVTSVTGTNNRITSTGGTTPVIDLSASYVGQSSITTLGTIGMGTWQGTAVADTYVASATNWNTAYTNRITSLTTTGSSGAATLSSNVLNVPTYTLSGLGGTTLTAVNAQNLSVFASTTSAQLLGVISDETGSGALVFATSPTLVTPALGVATATTINKVAITAPATSATLTIADGKTLTSSNTLILAGTDGSTLNIGTGGTLGSNAYTSTTYAPATDVSILKNVNISTSALVNHFGDSFTAGNNSSTTAKRYTSTIDEALSTVEANWGVSGTGVFTATGAMFTNEAAFPNTAPATVMIGFNDVRAVGATAKNIAKIQGAHLAMIANHFLKTAVAANNGSVTTSGTWTTVTAGTYKDKASLSLSGLARTSTVLGSTLTYTSTGESLVIGCWGTDGTADGRFTVSVDGTVRATFDPTNLNTTSALSDGASTRCQNAVVLFGLGGSTHTIVITTLDNKPTAIDYIGTLQANNLAPALLIGGVVKEDAIGYAAAFTSYGTTITDADNDAADAAIQISVNLFRAQGYPVVFVNTNKYYDRTTGVYTDHIHPNDIGHGQIARAFLDQITYGEPGAQKIFKSNLSTTQAYVRATSDNGTIMQMLVYPSAQASGGWIAPNAGYIGGTPTTINIGSQSASSTVNVVAGGTTSNDIKLSVSSSGSVAQSSNPGNATLLGYTLTNTNTSGASNANIFAVSSSTTGLSQFRATSDNGTLATIVTYGSGTVTAGIIEANASAFFNTGAKAYFGTTNTSGTVYFLNGVSSTTASIKGSITTGGLWNIGDSTASTACLTVKAVAVATGNQGLLTLIGAAHTNQTLSTELTDINFNLARTVQFATGALTTQRAIRIQAPTYGFVGASTITDAVTWEISGAPAAGTNATITRSWAARILGNTAISTALYVGASTTVPTAKVHIASASGSANTAAIQADAGTNESSIRSGLLEFNNAWYASNSALNRVGLGGKIAAAFADTGNTSTTETDLHTYTSKTNTLLVNGADLEAEYGGIFVSSGTATRQIKVYFGGTAIFDTGALSISLAASWTTYATIMRVSSTVVRYMISLTTEGAALSAYTAVGELTGLTLSNTNILKITGTAAGVGAATNDIVLKQAKVSWNPAVDN